MAAEQPAGPPPMITKVIPMAITAMILSIVGFCVPLVGLVGLILGTLFRFVAYRTWVFPAVPDDAADQELAERDAATPI